MPRHHRGSRGIDLFLRWLKREGVSQYAAARSLGVTPAAVSQWLSRRTRPSLDTAAKIEVLTGGDVPASSWVD